MQLQQELLARHRIPRLDHNPGYLPIKRGFDADFHLHGFKEQQGLAFYHLLPSGNLD